MANDYIKLWVKDYRALLEPFNEAERGRILWAMMDYKETGEEPQFPGNERFVWAAIKAKIDASNEAYERQAAVNRENGARGGRPKKSETSTKKQKNPAEMPEKAKEPEPQKTDYPEGTPENYWISAGCGEELTPFMLDQFQQARKDGFSDDLIVAVLEEAMQHQAKQPWMYARRLLDQAKARGTVSLAEWAKHHVKYKGDRVDRAEPSGKDFLLGAGQRKIKKKSPPGGKDPPA